MKKKIKSALVELIPLIIITVPAFWVTLNNQYFSMHDDQHIARLFLLDTGLKQGMLYPRWVHMLGFGFGYPLFNFYPPLIYYIAEFFHLSGFSLIWSIKLMIITGFITGAVGMYYLAKPYLGKAAGLLSAVLYTYFTYHAVVPYVRGAFAEFFAMSLFPILIGSLFRLYRTPSMRSSVWFGISLALMILCHPLIAFPSVLFIILIGSILLVLSKERLKFLIHSKIGGIIGLGLSAFFWLPSIIEKKYTLIDKILTGELASYKLHFIYPSQFWYSPWGFGGSAAGPYDGLTFQLGKIHIALVFVSLILSFLYVRFVIKNKLPQSKKFPAIQFFYISFASFLVSIFLASTYSQFIWDRVQFLWYTQFPWRFLALTSVFISISGAFCVYFITHLYQQLNTKQILFGMTLILSVVTIATYGKYFHPRRMITTNDMTRTTYDEIAWRVSGTSYEFVPIQVATKKTKLGTTIVNIEKSQLPEMPYEILSGDAQTTIVKNNFNHKEFYIDAKTETIFQLKTYNFPGWTSVIAIPTKVGRSNLKISDSNPYKLITVNIPPGKHSLAFKFEDTPIRKIGNTLSIVCLIITVSFVARKTLFS